MVTSAQRRKHRPLPWGLHICEVCGEARGRTPDGLVSACYCSGIVCNWCGRRFHRPVSNHWSVPDGPWVHVPYFGFQGCRCSTPPEGYDGPKFTHLPKADEVTEASEELTRQTLEWAATLDEMDDE